ncbi:hypothetical protein [Azospirillum argentinense]
MPECYRSNRDSFVNSFTQFPSEKVEQLQNNRRDCFDASA